MLFFSPRAASSGLSSEQKSYANDLIDRYTNSWRTSSRPTSEAADNKPNKASSTGRQLFADESKYVDELIAKYASPSWSYS